MVSKNSTLKTYIVQSSGCRINLNNKECALPTGRGTIPSEPGFHLCIYVLVPLGLDQTTGLDAPRGKGPSPSHQPLHSESSDATWYSSSSLQKTFTQQKQMLGPQPAVASQSCHEESGIQFKIQFSLKQLTWLAHISPDWPGEATVPSSKTGKLITAVEALVGKLSPVQP